MEDIEGQVQNQAHTAFDALQAQVQLKQNEIDVLRSDLDEQEVAFRGESHACFSRLF